MGIVLKNIEGQIACSCCGSCSLQPRLVICLERLAAAWFKLKGRPIRVTSVYRCVKHNSSPTVKGAKGSKHLLGQAADCAIKKIDQEEFIKLAKECGFTGIGIGQTFVHIDVRAIPVEPWIYPTRETTK